jgi:hypothetical protein
MSIYGQALLPNNALVIDACAAPLLRRASSPQHNADVS